MARVKHHSPSNLTSVRTSCVRWHSLVSDMSSFQEFLKKHNATWALFGHFLDRHATLYFLRIWCKEFNSGGRFSFPCLFSSKCVSLSTSTECICSSFPACFDFSNSCGSRSTSFWNLRYPDSFSRFFTKEPVTFTFFVIVSTGKILFFSYLVSCHWLCAFCWLHGYLFHTIIASSRKIPNKNNFCAWF